MTRALITPSNLSNIAGAIREKNGTTTTYKPGEMGDAIRALNIERNVINGIIEQYKAQTDTISADTFVEFVNGAAIAKGTDTLLLNVSNSYSYASSAQIDTNKVFVAHRNGDYLNGVVCTISGTAITVGTAVALSNIKYSYYYPSVVKLATNKVFIAHRRGSYLGGIVCTISGTTITVGTDTNLVSASNSYNYIDAVLIDTNKVFIARSNSNQFLSGIVCTISGTTITPGTDTILVGATMSYYYISVVKLATNKVFIAHRSDGTNSYLNGIICTISGTTITPGTDTTLVSTAGSSWYASAVLVATNKIFIAHSNDNSNYHLNALICTISGTTITPGTDTTLIETSNSSYYASAVLIDANNIFIAHRGSNLNALICTISGTTITPGTDIVLSTASYSYNYIFSVLIDTNRIFTSYRRSSYLGGIVCEIERKFIAPSSTKIEGLTKTECTTSTIGDVWVFSATLMEDFDYSYFNIVSAAIDTPDSGYKLGVFPVDVEYIEYSSMDAAGLISDVENGDYNLRDITVADAFSDFEYTSYIEIYDSSGEYSTEEDISYFDNYYLVTKFAGLCEQRTNGSAQQYQTGDGMDCQMFFNCKNNLFIGDSGSKPTHLVLFTEYADTITLVEIDPNSIDSTTGQFTAYAPYFGIIGLVYKDE